MYFLLKMGIFQPAMLVHRRVHILILRFPLRNGYLGADRSALLEFWSPFPARETLVESQPAQDVEMGGTVSSSNMSVFFGKYDL